jgi:hypothetical protein
MRGRVTLMRGVDCRYALQAASRAMVQLARNLQETLLAVCNAGELGASKEVQFGSKPAEARRGGLLGLRWAFQLADGGQGTNQGGVWSSAPDTTWAKKPLVVAEVTAGGAAQAKGVARGMVLLQHRGGGSATSAGFGDGTALDAAVAAAPTGGESLWLRFLRPTPALAFVTLQVAEMCEGMATLSAMLEAVGQGAFGGDTGYSRFRRVYGAVREGAVGRPPAHPASEWAAHAYALACAVSTHASGLAEAMQSGVNLRRLVSVDRGGAHSVLERCAWWTTAMGGVHQMVGTPEQRRLTQLLTLCNHSTRYRLRLSRGPVMFTGGSEWWQEPPPVVEPGAALSWGASGAECQRLCINRRCGGAVRSCPTAREGVGYGVGAGWL